MRNLLCIRMFFSYDVKQCHDDIFNAPSQMFLSYVAEKRKILI